MAELGQEALPVLHAQLGVLGQLPFDHQRLTRGAGARQGGQSTGGEDAAQRGRAAPRRRLKARFTSSAPGRAHGVPTRRDLFQSGGREQGWKISSWDVNAAGGQRLHVKCDVMWKLGFHMEASHTLQAKVAQIFCL